MRKTAYILLSAVFALMSCNREELQPANGAYPMCFNVGLLTKARANSVDDLKIAGSSMALCGTIDGEKLFEAQTVSWNNSGAGAWTYTPIKYWKASSSYKFRAVWPSSAGTYTDGLTGNDAVIAGFTVSNTVNSQTDLLMSDLESVTTPASISSQPDVTLRFRHILSKVIFKVRKASAAQDDDEFRIVEFSVTGMKNKGTFTGSSTSGNWNYTGATTLTCTQSYEGSDYPVINKGDWADSRLIWPDGLLLLPQPITGDVRVNITFSVKHDGKTTTKSLSPSLPTPEGSTGWEQGKIYIYQLDINQQYNIIFATPIVESWGTEQPSGTVIID